MFKDLKLSRDWGSRELAEWAEEWNLSFPSHCARRLAGVDNEVNQLNTFMNPHNSGSPGFDDSFRDRAIKLLYDGPGVALIHGIPVKTEESSASWLWGFGKMLGYPVPQSLDGARIGRVEDLGANYENPTHRGHKSSAALPFHSDRADVIALLCVRNASQGGHSQLASVARVYKILQNESPELLNILEKPFPYDRRGEQSEGEKAWTELPVFVRQSNRIIARYIRRFIESSQRHIDAPRLAPEQVLAMDALDAILQRPEVVFEMKLQEGQLQLIENHTIMHARSAFSGGDRLLFRLWLSTRQSPKLPESFLPVYKSINAGTVRGGVWSKGNDDVVGVSVASTGEL